MIFFFLIASLLMKRSRDALQNSCSYQNSAELHDNHENPEEKQRYTIYQRPYGNSANDASYTYQLNETLPLHQIYIYI